MIEELIDTLTKASAKHSPVLLSKSEIKALIAVLKDYKKLIKKLDGDWTEEKE